MRLPFKFKLGARMARALYPKLLKFGYRFVDLDAESTSLDSRVIEYSYVISKIAKAPVGRILDVGCSDGGNMAMVSLAWLGCEIHGIDLRESKFKHPNFHFHHGDIRNTSFPDNYFDCVYAISMLEHIGLAGRYGVTESDPEGDLKAVREIARILRPGGSFLVTIPCGKGQLIKPLQRVYDRSRLNKIFSGWKIKEEVYYLFQDGYWTIVPEEEVADKDFLKGERALALLEMTPSKQLAPLA